MRRARDLLLAFSMAATVGIVIVLITQPRFG